MAETIELTIGGESVKIPPMPFYCLKLAWPHIMRLGALGVLTDDLEVAKTRLDYAEPEQRAALLVQHQAAVRAAETEGADMIGQTNEALCIVAAALSLMPFPPSSDDLAKRLLPEEMGGVQVAVSSLLRISGLLQTGEVKATAPAPPVRSNGTASPRS